MDTPLILVGFLVPQRPRCRRCKIRDVSNSLDSIFELICNMCYSALKEQARSDWFTKKDVFITCHICKTFYCNNLRNTAHDCFVPGITWCRTCGHQVESDSYLRQHCRAVHGCDSDEVNETIIDTRGWKVKLPKPLKCHSSSKLYRCPTCQKLYATAGFLVKHQRFHCGKKRFVCETCKKGFAKWKRLETHMQRHTDVRQFQCEICQKRFCRLDSYRGHIGRVHIKEKSIECDLCKKRFLVVTDLNRHCRRQHSDNIPHECKLCKKRFVKPDDLEAHLNKKHNSEAPLECTVCKVRFRTGFKLRTHMATHSDERPFECNICKKYYKLSCSLKKHMQKVHS